MNVTIRPACPLDAETILIVHGESVRGVASTYYPADVIEAWAGELTPERTEKFRRAVESGWEIVVVALVDDRMVGFGSIVPNHDELRGLFVHPDFASRGVGSAILSELERLAVSQGLTRLHMDASLNAEAFYRRHGYVTIECGKYRFRSGAEMACAKMVKSF